MPDTPSSSLLARRARTRRKPRALEAADMGTAFGMEYTLDQKEPSAGGVKPVPAENPMWWPRWLRGSSRG